jgi:hypothetical protein
VIFLLVVGLFFILWLFFASLFIGALIEITTRTDLILWHCITFLAALIATLLIYWGVIE